MLVLQHPRALFLLLMLLTGAATVIAFAPLSFWPLAFLMPAILFYVWLHASPSWSFWLGYVFGLGFFGAGISWVYNSIHDFGYAPVPLAAALTALMVLVLSLFPALAGYLQARFFSRQPALRLLLVMPALWVLLEWLRGWIFTGFPWLYIGNTQLETPLSNVASILGVLGVSWLVLIIIGLLVLMLQHGLKQRFTVLVSIGVIVLLSFLAGKINWTEPLGEPIKVTLVQGNIAQGDKWKKEWLQPTMQRYYDLTAQHWDSDLIIWPEVALPGYYQEFRQFFLDPLAEEAKSHQTDILMGTLYAENKKGYNSIVRIGNGNGVYHKRHLVPFGEYIPLRSFLGWLDGLIVLPASDIDGYDKAVVLEAAGQKFSSSICYEDAFGAEMAEMLPEATLLVNVSNDAWFGDSLAPHQHLEIARMRSIELGRDLLRANNTGITAFVDYRGRIKQTAQQFETTTLTDTVQPRTGTTPFVWWKNYAIVVLLLLSLLLAWWFGRKTNAR